MFPPVSGEIKGSENGCDVSGYVRLHRSLIGHPAFRNDAEAMAFAWMIARAQWQPARLRYKGLPVQLQRGQLCVSQRDMATAMDRDKAWIERLWKRLIREAMIEAKHGAAAMVITICNYDKYQHMSDEREAAGEAVTTPPSEAEVRQGRGTEQVREEGKKVVANATTTFPRPAWADVQVWSDFMANRKRRRAVNTETAYAGFLADVERLTNDEWPPPRLLQHAVAKGWAGIYEPGARERGNGNGNSDRQSGWQTAFFANSGDGEPE